MRALSEAQFRAATEGGVPEPERVFGRSGEVELWSVPIPMRGELLDYTLSAILLDPDGPVTVLDPGWEGPETRARLERALARLGRGLADIAHIVVTHAHPDHIGAAEELRRSSGASVLLHEREQASIDRVAAARTTGGVDVEAEVAKWGVPVDAKDRVVAQLARLERGRTLPGPADLLLRDDEALPILGVDWRVVWTPGHTAGHICIVDGEHRILLSGDHVLPTLFPGIGLDVDWGLTDGGEAERNPVADFVESLERLRPYDDFDVLPGHGYRFSGLGARREEATEHILKRAREVAAADRAAPGATIWRLAAGLTWSAGWERLVQSPMLPSALRQAGMYRDFVRSGGLDGRAEV